MRRRHAIAIAALIAAGLLAGALALAPVFERPRMVVSGTADVGGPFTLTAHTGERISEEAFRGQGLGRQAVEHAFARCLENGVRALRLEVTPGITGAAEFYRRVGFEDLGRRLLVATPSV